MQPADFRALGHELVDWVADYRERIGEFPVMSRVQPGEVAAHQVGRGRERDDRSAGEHDNHGQWGQAMHGGGRVSAASRDDRRRL